MNSYDFVHLAFFAWGGRVRGKTKLQKLIYFLGVTTDHLDELGYVPHFYGPYSAEVADAVDALRGMGFLEQSVVCFGYDSAGFEAARYDYRLNRDGEMIARQKAARQQDLWRQLQKAVRQLKAAGEKDYVKLSIAAKTYFLLGEKKETQSNRELAALAPKFGWSVTPAQIKDAARYLNDLGLVELTKAK